MLEKKTKPNDSRVQKREIWEKMFSFFTEKAFQKNYM